MLSNNIVVGFMEIRLLLTQFGLSLKEADVYLACLAKPLIISEIVKMLPGSKRSTVVFWLDKLVQKGLLDETRDKNRRRFQAIESRKLLDQHQDALKQLEKSLPRFEAQKKMSVVGKPKIRVYSSIEGFKSVLEELLKDRPWEFRGIANNNLFMDLASEQGYFKQYRLRRFRLGIKARFLVVDNDWGQEIMRVQKKYNIEAQLLPKHYQFESEIVAWNNKIVNAYYVKPHVIVVLVESKPIAEIHRAIFEMLWDWNRVKA